MTDDKMLIIGRFGAPHGIRGEIKVFSFTRPETNVFNFEAWYIKKQGEWLPLTHTSKKTLKDGFVVAIEGYNDCDVVRELTNIEFAIDKTALPTLAPDEFYWKDLEGLSVKNTEGHLLGQIDHLFETGSNDVIVVRSPQGKKILIPYLFHDTVLKVDLETGEMTVDWE